MYIFLHFYLFCNGILSILYGILYTRVKVYIFAVMRCFSFCAWIFSEFIIAVSFWKFYKPQCALITPYMTYILWAL